MSESPRASDLQSNSSGWQGPLSPASSQSRRGHHQPSQDQSNTSYNRSPTATPHPQHSDPYEQVYPGIMHNPVTKSVCVSVQNFDQHSYTVNFNSPRTIQAMSQLGLEPSELLSVPLTSFEEKLLAEPNAVSTASLLIFTSVNDKTVGIQDRTRASRRTTSGKKPAQMKHSIEQRQKLDSLRLQAKIEFERFETLRQRELNAVKKQRQQIIKENQHKQSIRNQVSEDAKIDPVRQSKHASNNNSKKSTPKSSSSVLSRQKSRRQKDAALARDAANDLETCDLLVSLNSQIQSLREQELNRQDMVLQIQRDKLAQHVRSEIQKCKQLRESRRKQISEIKRVEIDCVYVWESIVKKKQEHKLRLRNMQGGFEEWQEACLREFEEERSNTKQRAFEDGRPFEGVASVQYTYGTVSYEEARARSNTGVAIPAEIPVQPMAPKLHGDAVTPEEEELLLLQQPEEEGEETTTSEKNREIQEDEDPNEDVEIRVNDGQDTNFDEYDALNNDDNYDPYEQYDEEQLDEDADEEAKLRHMNRQRRQSQILFDFDLEESEHSDDKKGKSEHYDNLLTFDEGVILGSRRRSVTRQTTDLASVQSVGDELFGFVAQANNTPEDNPGPLLTIYNVAQKAYSQLVLQQQALERHQRAEVSRLQFSFAAERQQLYSEQQRVRSQWEDERREFQRFIKQQDKKLNGEIRQIRQHERLAKVFKSTKALKQQREQRQYERLRCAEERQELKQQEEDLSTEAKQLKQQLKNMQITSVQEREVKQRQERLEKLKQREQHNLEQAKQYSVEKKSMIQERNRLHAEREKNAKKERIRLDEEKRKVQVEIAERLHLAEERCQVLLGERDDEQKRKRLKQILYTQDRQLHMVRAKRITMYRAELANKKRQQDDERLRRAQEKKASWSKEREELHKRGQELMNTAHSRLNKLISTDVSNIARLDPSVADELALMILPPIQYKIDNSTDKTKKKHTTSKVTTIHESPNDE